MRLPYAPTTPTDDDPATQDIYTRIAARRHPRPLIPLDLTLLHAPPVADGYNAFLGAIRTQTTLSQALLELAVCRVGALNDAVWEWRAHSAIAVREGVSRAALVAALDTSDEQVGRLRRGEDVQGLDARQAAVVAYTDAMTREVKVPEEVWERLRGALGGEREVVELTAGVAAYNCVSRFLVALDVGECNGGAMEVPADAK